MGAGSEGWLNGSYHNVKRVVRNASKRGGLGLAHNDGVVGIILPGLLPGERASSYSNAHPQVS